MRPRLGQFDIVEEYTLDDNGCTDIDTSVETDTPKTIPEADKSLVKTTSVEVDSTPSSSSQAPSTNLTVETTPPALATIPKIVYSNDNTDFYVETASKEGKAEALLSSDAEPIPSAYPWKKKLTVRLKRLSDFDINLWCNTLYDSGPDDTVPVETITVKQETTSEVHTEETNQRTGSKRKLSQVETEPDVKPILTATSGEPMSQLIAHGNKLINRVSAALDVNQDVNQQPVPAVQHSPALSTNVETATVQPKRTVHCKLCAFSCYSVQGLNEHHKEDHGIVTCTTCGKNFETNTALDKHMYCHTKPAAFCCEECGQ